MKLYFSIKLRMFYLTEIRNTAMLIRIYLYSSLILCTQISTASAACTWTVYMQIFSASVGKLQLNFSFRIIIKVRNREALYSMRFDAVMLRIQTYSVTYSFCSII